MTSAPEARPQPGRISVGVATGGSDRNIETMTFAVDIQPRGTFEPIRADAGLYTEELPVGTYVVQLTRLPKQCRVNGASRRRVTISARRTTTLRFAVTCGRRER